MSASKSVLVIRATGTQGTAVTRHLIKAGWTVHAYVVSTTEPRALALQSLSPNVQLFAGTLEDPLALSRAVSGCTGVFLNQMPSFQDPKQETRQASAILDAAKAAGVKTVVHSTSLGIADLANFVDTRALAAPAIYGKADVEDLVRNAGFENWTILRPGYFMTNFLPPFVMFMFPQLITERTFVSSYKPDTLLPLIDPNDIGAFAVAAFIDPGKFSGQAVALAGQKLAVSEVIAQLGKSAGFEIKTVYRTDEESDELAKTDFKIEGQRMTLNLHKVVEIGEVEKWGIPLGTFEGFLEREKERVVEMFKSDGKNVIKFDLK
jgi:uncharacterized protein YbjT (DUF2867 family)